MDTSWNRKKDLDDYYKWRKEEPKPDPYNQPPPPSLVKYKGSVMVGDSSYLLKGGRIKPLKHGHGERLKLVTVHEDPPDTYLGPPICRSSTDTKHQLAELFSKMIPSRQWIVNGILWRQSVASTPSTIEDVITLSEDLKDRLKEKKAMAYGICPIRSDLYGQCLDELLRQITINCAERGLLLRRVRDESNHTVERWKNLYYSALIFRIRNYAKAKAKNVEIKEQINIARVQRARAEEKIGVVQQRFEEIAIRLENERNFEKTRHFEEAHRMYRLNEILRGKLEKAIDPRSPAQKRAQELAEAKAKAGPIDVFRSKEDIQEEDSFTEITEASNKSEIEDIKDFLRRSRRVSKASQSLVEGRKLSTATDGKSEEDEEGVGVEDVGEKDTAEISKKEE